MILRGYFVFMETKTKKLTTGAICITISTILSYVKISLWANGGSVTLLVALPIFIFSYKYGFKWGVFCGFTFGALQGLLEAGGLKGVTLFTFVMSILIDYLVAYGCYGIVGIFNKKKTVNHFLFGAFLSLTMRFICHFISGFWLFGSLSVDGFGAVIYSFTYNISYMLPETIITLVGCYFAFNIFKKAKLI